MFCSRGSLAVLVLEWEFPACVFRHPSPCPGCWCHALFRATLHCRGAEAAGCAPAGPLPMPAAAEVLPLMKAKV